MPVPYVNGFIWDLDTESWRTEDADRGAVRNQNDGLQVWSWGGNRFAAMCPDSKLWRDKLTEVSTELVGRYGMDGIYFDFLTGLICDCYNPDHGHAIGGGNYFSKSVHDLYGQVRREIKKLNPDAMVTGEHVGEFVIDVLDTQLPFRSYHNQVPSFEAVYHGYTLLYGGWRGPRMKNSMKSGVPMPYCTGLFWLNGNQSGWGNHHGSLAQALKGDPRHQQWIQDAKYYFKLLHCHHRFGRPYLAYGEMLRPPHIEGDLPFVHIPYGDPPAPMVEGRAWKAPDGTVGIFFLNYDTKQAHDFTWTVDLQEAPGWDGDTQLTLSKWTLEDGLVRVAAVTGGQFGRRETIEPWGLIALKLEAAR